ncbi:putative RING finger protein [Smittium mucronatum]|uniref:Putative RING finger protein n=1 Tax=Smittium mucronatum TaxID=133383 RepID=A0A1R0GT10_9FUNG|nr:putative RING finger protein [Smittium mucronatum]
MKTKDLLYLFLSANWISLSNSYHHSIKNHRFLSFEKMSDRFDSERADSINNEPVDILPARTSVIEASDFFHPYPDSRSTIVPDFNLSNSPTIQSIKKFCSEKSLPKFNFNLFNSSPSFSIFRGLNDESGSSNGKTRERNLDSCEETSGSSYFIPSSKRSKISDDSQKSNLTLLAEAISRYTANPTLHSEDSLTHLPPLKQCSSSETLNDSQTNSSPVSGASNSKNPLPDSDSISEDGLLNFSLPSNGLKKISDLINYYEERKKFYLQFPLFQKLAKSYYGPDYESDAPDISQNIKPQSSNSSSSSNPFPSSDQIESNINNDDLSTSNSEISSNIREEPLSGLFLDQNLFARYNTDLPQFFNQTFSRFTQGLSRFADAALMIKDRLNNRIVASFCLNELGDHENNPYLEQLQLNSALSISGDSDNDRSPVISIEQSDSNNSGELTINSENSEYLNLFGDIFLRNFSINRSQSNSSASVSLPTVELSHGPSNLPEDHSSLFISAEENTPINFRELMSSLFNGITDEFFSSNVYRPYQDMLGSIGDFGDYVLNHRNLDEVISDILQQTMSGSSMAVSEDLLNSMVRKHPEDSMIETFKDCSICLEEFTPESTIIELNCLHFYHEACIVNWLRQNGRCPICRLHISSCIKDYGGNSTSSSELVSPPNAIRGNTIVETPAPCYDDEDEDEEENSIFHSGDLSLSSNSTRISENREDYFSDHVSNSDIPVCTEEESLARLSKIPGSFPSSTFSA